MTSVPHTVRIRRALENTIVEGRYMPDTRLDTEALEQEFNFSRTPISEAFQQPEVSSLVRVLPERGTYVSQCSPEDLAIASRRWQRLKQVTHASPRVASARRNWTHSGRSTTNAHSWPRRARSRNYYVRNSEFHHCIYRSTHNAFLIQEPAFQISTEPGRGFNMLPETL